jgi:HAD superfamily hydrolase (TIGR01458 family)
VGVLLDIDGTLMDSGRAIDGAAEAVRALRARRIPLLFATNISRKARGEVAASLRDAGIEARDEEVLNAGWAAAVLLRADGVRRVHLMLTPSAAVDWHGFDVVDEGADAVVVGDMGRRFDFDRLERAFRCLRDGARLVAAHRNPWWKDDRGEVTLDAGTFVAALEYAAGVKAELVGKPAADFFRMAARVLGEDPGRLVMVGDDLVADVAGGRAAGLATYLVRTGKFDAAALARTPPERAPHRVIESVRELPAALEEAAGGPGPA